MAVWLCDIDGTLCEEVCWTPEQCLAATPRQDVIAKVNELYKEHFVVLWTARRPHLYEATIEWLGRNNVHYHAYSDHKIPCEGFVDDKAVTIEDFLRR